MSAGGIASSLSLVPDTSVLVRIMDGPGWRWAVGGPSLSGDSGAASKALVDHKARFLILLPKLPRKTQAIREQGEWIRAP